MADSVRGGVERQAVEPLTAPLAALDAPRYDSLILLVVGLLMTLGCVIVYSASVTVDGASFDLQSWWRTPARQLVFVAGGFAAMVFMAHLDYRFFAWERRGEGWYAGVLALLAAVLLVAVFIPGIGESRLGAQRAIVLLRGSLPLSFQPSEFAKLAMVVWLAALLSRSAGGAAGFWSGYLPALGSAGVLIGLTVIEDYGTAALMGVVMFAMLYIAGARWLHLLGTALLGAMVGVAAVLREPYRIQRIRTFLSENPDPMREGYQVEQSLIAIGSGGWWGRGLGAGVQKYDYLPQDNNDFVLAVLCEEMGVLGGISVMLLFVVLLFRGWRLARLAVDPFGRLLAAGITLTLCLQAAFNCGVVTNSVPTKGISLPFVSAGGSGVLFLGMAAGLLASVARGVAPRTR